MLNRRSFLAGLLATATAPVLPPIPGPRDISYTVFEDIPLGKFGNREYAYYWTPIRSVELGPVRALWSDRTRVYSPA